MERADPMGAKMDSKNAIFVGRTQGHWPAAEGLADVHIATHEADVATHVDFANDVSRPVFDRRKRIRKRTRACTIVPRRHVELKRFVRSFVIVDVPPAVESTLTSAEVGEA